MNLVFPINVTYTRSQTTLQFHSPRNESQLYTNDHQTLTQPWENWLFSLEKPPKKFPPRKKTAWTKKVSSQDKKTWSEIVIWNGILRSPWSNHQTHNLGLLKTRKSFGTLLRCNFGTGTSWEVPNLMIWWMNYSPYHSPSRVLHVWNLVGQFIW